MRQNRWWCPQGCRDLRVQWRMAEVGGPPLWPRPPRRSRGWGSIVPPLPTASSHPARHQLRPWLGCTCTRMCTSDAAFDASQQAPNGQRHWPKAQNPAAAPAQHRAAVILWGAEGSKTLLPRAFCASGGRFCPAAQRHGGAHPVSHMGTEHRTAGSCRGGRFPSKSGCCECEEAPRQVSWGGWTWLVLNPGGGTQPSEAALMNQRGCALHLRAPE